MEKLSQYIINETLSKSYDLSKFIDKVKLIYSNVYSSQYFKFEPGRCLIVFTDNFDKENPRLQSLMNLFNVFISRIETDDTYPENSTYVYFEQKYSKNVTNDVYKYDKVYHLTKSKYVDKILKYGLVPKTRKGKYKKNDYHPDRIYLLRGDIDKRTIKTYQGQLLASSLIIVDLKKLKDDYNTTLKFYKDPQSVESYAVYIDSNIRPEVLKVSDINTEFK